MINYKVVFDAFFENEKRQRKEREQIINEVENHLSELEEVIEEALKFKGIEYASVFYDESEDKLTVDYMSRCLEIKFNKEHMNLEIADRVIENDALSFNVTYEDEVEVEIYERDEVDYKIDDELIHLYTYVLERVAKMIVKEL